MCIYVHVHARSFTSYVLLYRSGVTCMYVYAHTIIIIFSTVAPAVYGSILNVPLCVPLYNYCFED